MSLRGVERRSNPLKKGWDCRATLAMTIYCMDNINIAKDV
jgi:hypothetical protein